jgi:phosphate-selective porin
MMPTKACRLLIISSLSASLYDNNPGAIELVFRCSYLDLDDHDIDGGSMTVTSMGLNWHFTHATTLRVSTGYSNINGGNTPGRAIVTQTQLSIHF